MSKPKTLHDFHFDPQKSGIILKNWIKEKNLSYSFVSEATGISLDTLNNSINGKVMDLRIERVFKIATLTGHSVCEYLRLMLDDENIDFADNIKLLLDSTSLPVRYVDTLPQVDTDEDIALQHRAATAADFDLYAQHMHAEHAEILDRFKNVYANQFAQLNAQIEQLRDSRDRMQEQYKAQLALMEEQHRFHDHAMEVAHNKERDVDEQHFQLERAGWKKTIEQQDDHISRLRKNNMRCVLAICFEAFLLFLALLIILFR